MQISHFQKIVCNYSLTNHSFILTTRDASYTTQPLELLNDLGFDSAFNYDEVDGQFEIRDNGKVSPFPFSNTGPDGTAGNSNSAGPIDHSRESGSQINLEGSEG